MSSSHGEEAATASLTNAPVVDFGDLVADIDYPMLVVTAQHDEDRQGCLVGFSAQCSIEPPRFMVWISKKNRTSVTAGQAIVLGVHLLSASNVELARLFGEHSGDTTDKFSHCRWHAGPWGAPILEDCSRWFVGRILDRQDTGDHVAYLLDPVAVQAGPWDGQLGFQAARGFTPGHAA